MSPAPVRTSVIVVSRHRPEHLSLCLRGLAQLDHPDFEVIVVADPEGLAVTEALPVKSILFDEANISAARNAGIVVAAAPVIAFIDDDAVPEPTWLCRLTTPFADPRVVAAGGFVRGRNGISYQWKASQTDQLGVSHGLNVAGGQATLLPPPPEGAIRTEGTNCAFRRDAVAARGGFDPAFRFYLDETDLNLRLAASGGLTAIVPGAQVHHGFAPSARRRADRTPTDLHEVGASSAVFWRKHAPSATIPKARTALIEAQRARLADYRAGGRLSRAELGPLIQSLTEGLEAGETRPIDPLPAIGPASDAFLPFPAGSLPRRIIAGRIWQARAKRAEAARAVAQGAVVSLFLFAPSIRRHRVRFHPEGYWEQSGGLWGKSDRDQPAFTPWRFAARLRHEIARIAPFRGL
ncbi:glycosyltransferase family 2 protein [Sedimentimonas flavescens]|uniref:glycosyltransferase family 2 protein n=1 Tax=Sedimentimonas flavescens TaxID=2851012 RepID=UPI0021A4BBE7|nr:glycosyltransferase [Sedimentimonas flavescens]MCT2541050.1 glycosyltransferase [Sedimentimonas flavescens]